MSVSYKTTIGRYGSVGGHPASSQDPTPPALEGDYAFTMVGAAAADGMLFWFWRCDPIDLPIPEVIHQLQSGKALCGAGIPEDWPSNEKWSNDMAIINCLKCMEGRNSL